jgi:predicted NUDIX family NTP pyrophosphohydrolase
MFVKAMATGKLPSADVLREFVQVLNEMFGEEMIKKSFKLRNEEKRLSNAFQELGDEIGLLTYNAQIGGVRALTNLTKSVGGFAGEANRVAEYTKGLFSSILPEKGGVVEKTARVVGGTAVDLYKMAVGSPFYAAKYGGAYALAQGASLMGDDSLKENFGSWAKEEFLKNNFEDLQNVYKTDFTSLINALKDGQKVDITIKSDNNIRVEDVKSSRPSTVRAGQK